MHVISHINRLSPNLHMWEDKLPFGFIISFPQPGKHILCFAAFTAQYPYPSWTYTSSLSLYFYRCAIYLINSSCNPGRHNPLLQPFTDKYSFHYKYQDHLDTKWDSATPHMKGEIENHGICMSYSVFAYARRQIPFLLPVQLF